MEDNLIGKKARARRSTRRAARQDRKTEKKAALAGLTGKAKRSVKKDIRQDRRKAIISKAKTKIGDAKLKVLAPLKYTMRKILGMKGIATPKSIKLVDLATLFHNKIIAAPNQFEELDTNWYEGTPAFALTEADVYHTPEAEVNNFVGDVAELINTIVKYFANNKKKADAVTNEAQKSGMSETQAAMKMGVTLSPEDMVAADAVHSLDADDEKGGLAKLFGGNGITGSVGGQVGTTAPDYTNLIYVALIGLVIWILVKK